jgi:hypothetical protein
MQGEKLEAAIVDFDMEVVDRLLPATAVINNPAVTA